MLLQLDPHIPVIVDQHDKCPGGPAEAIGWLDYSSEHDLIWICLMDHGGRCWQVQNRYVRGFPNVTMGRVAV